MRLKLIHGRRFPNEKLEDWGFDGPVLRGIEALHVTYGDSPVVWFENDTDFKEAYWQTGWEAFEERALQMNIYKNLVVTFAQGERQPTAYYGDWEVERSLTRLETLWRRFATTIRVGRRVLESAAR